MEYIYAALLLHKLGKPVNEENLKKVVAATGTEVDETKVKTLIAGIQGIDITAELDKASTMSVAPAASTGKAEEKKEEKKEEKAAESAAGLSALFG